MAETRLARIGGWCFRRTWWVVGIWLVAMVVGALASGPVFANLSGGNGPRSLESIEAQHVLDAESKQGATVFGEIDHVDPRSAVVRDAIRHIATDLSAIAGVAAVATPYDAGVPPTAGISTDGHAVVIRVTLDDLDGDAQSTAVDAVGDRLRALGRDLTSAGATGATVSIGGGPVLNDEANAQAQTDLSRAEELSLPITLVVLVFVFGGLLAAGMPVIGAIVSVFASMTVLLGFSRITDLDQNAVTVVTLLGLGLSVDYGLLLVARYREELGHGYDPDVALSRAWATAGRTIAFSALTVAAALTGLLMFGITALSALGAAGVSIALVAMFVSLTLTAALIGLAKKRIKPSRRAARAVDVDAETGVFATIARLVQRRPLVTAVATGVALLAAGLPLLSANVHLAGLDSLPRSLESVRVADDLAVRFGQSQTPAVTVVARTDTTSLDAWAARWAGTDGVVRVEPAHQVAPGLATVDIDSTGDPQGDAARDLVRRVRADRPPGVRSWVTGTAAVLDDLLALIMSRLPWAIGVTVLAMAVLLFAMTGSLVVPLKAIVMNLISLGATFGVLSAVFEHGFLAGPLHTLTVTGIDPFVIVSVFAFAFGLSMDYEVFLLSRIKEYVDHGVDNDRAVRLGLQRSGRIITSAALLMVIVFGCFLVGRIGNVQQIGLGLAVAVAIDATLVRCVLVPATMTMLGRWNWWAPVWLRRVHEKSGFGERVLPDAADGVRPEPALSRS